MSWSPLERAYAQRLKEKSTDELYIELAEARRAGSHAADELLVAELHTRGLRTDQPEDTPQ